MKILGLDVGSKRIGVAVSDEMGIIARGLPTIERESGRGVLEELRKIIGEESVGEIVVGFPINMNGTLGPQAKAVEEFAGVLKKELGLPMTLWDERMSTVAVERVMIEGGASRAKRKKKIDKLAAQIILQGYLNSKRQG